MKFHLLLISLSFLSFMSLVQSNVILQLPENLYKNCQTTHTGGSAGYWRQKVCGKQELCCDVTATADASSGFRCLTLTKINETQTAPNTGGFTNAAIKQSFKFKCPTAADLQNYAKENEQHQLNACNRDKASESDYNA